MSDDGWGVYLNRNIYNTDYWVEGDDGKGVSLRFVHPGKYVVVRLTKDGPEVKVPLEIFRELVRVVSDE